ncbi:MAG: hypothetical protein WBI20_14085 [Burkholderiaceae bacterium]
MGNFNVAYEYVGLAKASDLVGVSARDLVHAGAFGQVQICVNIFARTQGAKYHLVDENQGYGEADFPGSTEAQLEAKSKEFSDWLTQQKSNLMPDGIFEINEPDLRLFEMNGIKWVELTDALTTDEDGVWKVEFNPPVKIDRSDLVILTTEIDRIQKIEGINTKPTNRPLGRRERDNLLKLLIGMAIEGYSFDPTALKNTATKEIADDLAKHGIGLDEDTVRKYLKEATSTVLPAKPLPA